MDCGQQCIHDAIIITAVTTGQIHIVQKQKTDKYRLSCPSLSQSLANIQSKRGWNKEKRARREPGRDGGIENIF